MKTIEEKINWIRFLLGKARTICQRRGGFDGVFFEMLWNIDDHVEDALNTLIDLEKQIRSCENDKV